MSIIYQFGVIVHSVEVANLIQDLTKDSAHIYHVVVSTYENALENAENLLKNGCEVLICHGGSREAIFKEHGLGTILIERSDIDLLEALIQARKEASEVALTAYVTEPRDISLLAELSGVRIHEVRYQDHLALEVTLRSLLQQGVRVAVGGGDTMLIMNRLGGKTFQDIPRAANIRIALVRAISLAKLLRTTHAHLNSFKDVLGVVQDGVIWVGSDQSILFINDVAMRLLDCKTHDDIYKLYEKLFIFDVLQDNIARHENSIRISGRQCIVSSLPLCISAQFGGVVVVLHDAASSQGIKSKNRHALHERGFTSKNTFADILGSCPEIICLKEKIQLYAPSNLPVYIIGETGSGKELVAHSLHAASSRSQEAFIPVNCSGLPESLLESELFGYEGGAFTGALKSGKQGLFELAHKGTLFLDEIGGISQNMQSRLLRVLEAQEVMRIGGDKIIPVDVRVISASHVPLQELIQSSQFRADLFYRLVGLSLSVPPLRQRGNDILLLANYAIERRNKNTRKLSPRICEALMRYSWPGNVRELFAIMDNFAILRSEQGRDESSFFEIFSERCLGAIPLLQEAHTHSTLSDKTLQTPYNLKAQMLATRLKLLNETVIRCKGNKKQAARELGISYTTLRRLLSSKTAA